MSVQVLFVATWKDQSTVGCCLDAPQYCTPTVPIALRCVNAIDRHCNDIYGFTSWART